MIPWLRMRRDDVVEFGMQHRLAAADGDDGSAQRRQSIEPPEHFLGWHRRGKIVEFVAVRAGKVAAAHRNDMHQQRVLLVNEAPADARYRHDTSDGAPSHCGEF